MKKLTCREIGGTCDAVIEGETSEEMLNKAHKHVQEAMDDGHKEIVKQMESMTDEEIQEWKKGFEEKYANAEEA